MSRPLQVFLCHASQDKPAVRELYQRLKAEDWIDPWLDEEKLSFGQHWTTVIEDAIQDADIIIIFLSSNSVKREGFVQRELNYAWEISLEKPRESIFLIPFRLDDCIIPRYLSSRQWGDYFGDKKEKTFEILLRSLKQRHLQKLQLEAVEKLEHEQIEEETKKELARKEKRETNKKAVIDVLSRNVHEFIANEEKPVEIPKPETYPGKKQEKELFANLPKSVQDDKPITIAIPSKKKEEDKPVFVSEKEKEIKKPTSAPLKIRPYIIGGIVIVGLLCFAFGASYLIQNLLTQPTSTKQQPTTISELPTATRSPGLGSTMLGEDGMTLVFVPAGEFTMGSNSNNQGDERPEHQVFLDAYWIDQTEVTNAMHALCVDANECDPPNQSTSYTQISYYDDPEFKNFPVIYVSWNDAKAYCEWVGRRLPTEAEWEKAARGTNAIIYPWGNADPRDNLLNYSNNVGDTTAVGSYRAGASIYGAFDMSGNVWEWVNEWYDDSYYQNSPSSNPQGPESGGNRVLRGGSWDSSYSVVRSANRNFSNPTYASSNLGFRCSRSP